MADTANIQYNGSIIVKETLEATDTSNTVSLIHSKLDKSLGGSFNFNLGSVSEFSVVTGLQTTASLADIIFSDATTNHVKATFYDGMTAAGETSVDFFFATIESALSTGTPDATFKFANQTDFQPMLKGIGDFCIIPMANYSQNTLNYDVEVISSEATTTAKLTVLMANRD